MIVRSLSVALALVMLAAGAAQAQEPEPVQPTGATPQPIDPDRPDVTNGTHIVDAGLLQVEFGGVFSKSNATTENLGTPVTFRFGATDWLELRFGGDGFLQSTDLTGHQTGMGNTQLGAKLRLWSDPGGLPVVSVLPTINMPTASASKGLGSGESDFTLAFLTGADFLQHAHADVNYGIGLIGTGPNLPRFTQHLVSISASAEIPGPFTPYVESFWISRQEVDGRAVVAIDSGGIYQISPRYAIDGGVQAGLTADAPSFSAFAGFSAIIGNITGEHGVHARQRQSARRRAAALRKTGK
jgi:outer membrane putative beta-barrel porin/alpha-amylase